MTESCVDGMKHPRIFSCRWAAFLLAGLCALASPVLAERLILNPAFPSEAQLEVAAELNRRITLEFRFGTLLIDTMFSGQEQWTTLTIPGAEQTSESGLPELPQLSRWLRVGSGALRLQVVERDTLIRRFGVVRPAPEVVNRAGEDPVIRRADPVFYRSDSLFPAEAAKLSLQGTLGRVPLALVTINPVQYHAEDQSLILTTRMVLRVTMSRGGGLDNVGLMGRSSQDLSQILPMNPGTPEETELSGEPRLILVTEPGFLLPLQPFIEWKRQSGIPVETIVFSETASTASELRSQIQELCGSFDVLPEYLMLVGDVDMIPPFFGIGSSLTDHPYSLLDDEDYLPDISVGRLPCRTAAACGHWVNRLLSYERDGQLFSGHTGTVFSSAVALDPQHGARVANMFSASSMQVNTLQQPQTGTLPLLLNSLNNGPHWVFYIGHGFSQAWSSVDPDFENRDAYELDSPASSLVVSVACATVDLDYPGGSIAESWLSQPLDLGLLTYYGATESTAFFYSDTLGISTLQAIFEQGVDRLGKAADMGRLACAQYFPQPSGGVTEETIQQFLLVGDPSMRVYSRTPQPLLVNYPSVLPVGTEQITVTVEKNGQPLADALIVLEGGENGLYEMEYSSENGLAVLSVGDLDPAALNLTVTGPNAVPYRGQLHIVPAEGSFLQLANVAVFDPGGDGDHRADRGEECSLNIALMNLGNQPSAEETVLLSSNSPYLVITDSPARLGSAAPGDTVWLNEPVPMTVSDSVPDLASAVIEVNMAASSGDSAELFHPLTLHAPVIELLSSSLAEDSGDGDGRPEAGERLILIINLRNSGSEGADTLTFSLSASDDNLTFLQPSAIQPPVAEQESFSASFQLLADPSTPRGYSFDYYLEYQAGNVPSQGFWGSHRIGQVAAYLYILDTAPQQVDGIEAALQSLGIEYELGSELPLDLHRYQSLWIFCGVYPNARPLPSSSAAQITQYLNEGGNCYWEGADVWVFDQPQILQSYFHIQGINDGTGNAGPVEGEYGTQYAEYRFEYGGENSFIDQIEPTSGAFVMLRNAREYGDYPVCIGYDSGIYRTIGCSIETGALAGGESSTRVELVHDLLSWLGVESNADIFPPVIEHVPVHEYYRQYQPIELTADIQDAGEIASAEILYAVTDGESNTVPMEFTGGMYRGDIPGAGFGSVIRYRLRAADTGGYAAETDEFILEIVPRPEMPLDLSFQSMSRSGFQPHIEAGEEDCWSVTNCGDRESVLELHNRGGGTIGFTTDVFDCSDLKTVRLSFWNFLRSGTGFSGCVARVLGSLDGGANWPVVVWERQQEGGGLLEEGVVQTDMSWAAGESTAALKFEYAGEWYWRLDDIIVAGKTEAVTQPVGGVVIMPGQRQMTLSWNGVADSRYYEVLVTSNKNEEVLQVYATPDTTFLDLTASESDTRLYEVRAVLEPSRRPSVYLDDPPPVSRVAVLRPEDIRWNQKVRITP